MDSLPVAKAARFSRVEASENADLNSMILKAGKRLLTPVGLRRIPLAGGNVLVADVNQFFASFVPNKGSSKAQEFLDYLQNPPSPPPVSED
ncbi:hypothetical protein BASA82_000164 [Batrachochytrium salamandrivorans]|nr:hypothetical protein BASA81_001487 [Batrachochytrium salamandrivorans]KAH9262813.1 hypothetical protein BASA82_000164 [Batrachochytrium salamandrivorans]